VKPPSYPAHAICNCQAPAHGIPALDVRGRDNRFMHNALWPLFTSFSWQELRHHPWRNGAAVVAVMLGVALAFAVHLINASALDEFARGMRSVVGQADVQVQGRSRAVIDEALYGRLLRHPDVQSASPVIEINTYALLAQSRSDGPLRGSSKLAIRVLGVDALQVAGITPEVLPCPIAIPVASMCLRPMQCF